MFIGRRKSLLDLKRHLCSCQLNSRVFRTQVVEIEGQMSSFFRFYNSVTTKLCVWYFLRKIAKWYLTNQNNYTMPLEFTVIWMDTNGFCGRANFFATKKTWDITVCIACSCQQCMALIRRWPCQDNQGTKCTCDSTKQHVRLRI